MDNWGHHMVNAATTAAEMAAIGMGLEPDAFAKRMQHGAHLLAPTASDLIKYDVGTTFAGFHYDLNFLTVHGKNRYPGLYIWDQDFNKLAFKVPEGCLLMQSGIQFEFLTGGYVNAGYHEVMYTQGTKDALIRA